MTGVENLVEFLRNANPLQFYVDSMKPCKNDLVIKRTLSEFPAFAVASKNLRPLHLHSIYKFARYTAQMPMSHSTLQMKHAIGLMKPKKKKKEDQIKLK